VEDRQQLSVRLAAVCAGGLALLAIAPSAGTAEEAPAVRAPVPAADAGAQDALAPIGDAPEPAHAAAVGPSGEPGAEAVDLHRLHQEAAESFTAWDGDRDGFVAAPEAMEMTPEAFAAADRDGDGKLSLVEWVDARFPDAPAPPAPR